MNSFVGYARGSTEEQNLNLQFNTLLSGRCSRENILTDNVSGLKKVQSGLSTCIDKLTPANTLKVFL